ncbi:MAG: hypothetical protein QOH26_816 [Actinomycetota bacterium]|nr:hypothetical protein [Actinomycetota bacterium]
MWCNDCSCDKPPEDFPRNRRTKSGRGQYCKPCHNARNRATIKRLYGNTRHYHLKQRFGIGAAEVDAMIEAQGGLCALCREAPAVHVDHDHKTGKVRAILCEPCNGGLGQFKDNPRTIERAIEYLERAAQKVRKEDLP